MNMMLNKIHHIAIIVSDYKKSREFYVDKLGFEVIRENFRPARNDWKLDLKLGDCELEIFGIEGRPARPTNPEANGLRHRIEAHIIAEKVELSGMDVRLELIQKIRDEQKFPSFDALKERIAMDITAIKSILSQYFKGKI
jgi:catechol 2,3-dioxygenase-like lactoylglutathione lyase family enzyme